MHRRRGRPRKKGHHPDYIIIFCIFILAAFGLTMLASASSNLGKIKFDDTYYYLKHQIIYGLSVGLLGFFLASRIYYRHYEKLALWFLLGSIVLLALVFTPLGVTVKGASRWLVLGPVTFQPSEVIKLFFVIYLAAWLGRKPERQRHLVKGFLPFLSILGVITLLLLNQPATSMTAILMLTALIIYFLSGAKLKYIFATGILVALIFLVIIYATPYRWERILNFLNPEADLREGGYHLSQALNAIGSGKLFGVGYGRSTTKINYLPEPVGDSIFAVIAEELGLAGATALILVFFVLVLKILLLARRYPDRFGQLLLVGFGTLIALQVFVHIAAISGLIPLTGTPLPFISFGGTALAVFMTMGGIITNISRYS